jgi:competence protein ComEA
MSAAEHRVQGSPVADGPLPEAAPPAPLSSPGSGGDPPVPAAPGRLAARCTARLAASVWLPLAARSAAVVVTMAALAGVGAASTLEGAGVPLASQASAMGLDGLGVWLSPVPTEPEPSPHAHGEATPEPGEPVETADAASTTTAQAPAETPRTEAPPVEGPLNSGAPAAEVAPSSGITADGKVVLNTATAVELTRLPRIGPKKAQAIVELRQRLGRFKKPSDLLRVKGIGVKTLQKLMPHLVLDPPTSP